MEKPMRVQRCTTHHHACDCREWPFEQLHAAAIAVLRNYYGLSNPATKDVMAGLLAAVEMSVDELGGAEGEPMETAPKDRDIELLMGGEWRMGFWNYHQWCSFGCGMSYESDKARQPTAWREPRQKT